MESALPLVAAGALALLLGIGVTPLIIAVSHRRSWFDIPNERKIHTSPIPRLGGIGIFVGLIGGCLVVPLAFPALFPSLDTPRYSAEYIFVFLGFTIIHGMGLLDDFHNLRAWLKLLLQIIAAALVTAGGFTISFVSLPGAGSLSLGIFAYPITVLWIVAISNAINLVDGIDGLAGGIAAWTALSLALLSILSGQSVPALVSLSLLGAVMGFLAFNFPPARIFMGDSGSLLIGFVLAVIPLLTFPGRTSIEELAAPATLLLVPILDTILAIVRRVRQGRAIYSPDREHIHHRLLAIGLKETRILLIVYFVCVGAGVAAVTAFFVGRIERLVLLAGVWALSGAALGALDTAKRRKSAGARDFAGKH
jgi:UDP-GlcNAc:undecaprenyl-phosphate GlcNAc-1-phosphate transferase